MMGAAVVTVSICVHSTGGGIAQSIWAAEPEMVERIRGLLGKPACEIMMDGPAAAAIEQAGDAAGEVVVFQGDP